MADTVMICDAWSDSNWVLLQDALSVCFFVWFIFESLT
jgi:hypothetical protein